VVVPHVVRFNCLITVRVIARKVTIYGGMLLQRSSSKMMPCWRCRLVWKTDQNVTVSGNDYCLLFLFLLWLWLNSAALYWRLLLHFYLTTLSIQCDVLAWIMLALDSGDQP